MSDVEANESFTPDALKTRVNLGAGEGCYGSSRQAAD
jgi:hypothetical protein